LSIGFVYILFNPAFPRQIKIGCTARDSQRRASELSRQSGVPEDFVVLYDELVGNAKQVEKLLHDRFAAYRVRKNKEFFQLPPPEAVRALQQLALRFPVPLNTPSFTVDLLPHFTKYFGRYLDPQVVEIRLVQLPGTCYSGRNKATKRRQPNNNARRTTTRGFGDSRYANPRGSST
jgi:hypothetical protein